jgi:hypothetical protein
LEISFDMVTRKEIKRLDGFEGLLKYCVPLHESFTQCKINNFFFFILYQTIFNSFVKPILFNKWNEKNERSHKIQINKRKIKTKTNLYSWLQHHNKLSTRNCGAHHVYASHTQIKASLKQRYNIIWNPDRKVTKTSTNYYKTS